MSDSLWPYRILALQDPLSMGSPGEKAGRGCHALLQGIFLTQRLNPWLLSLLQWQVGFVPLVPPGKPRKQALLAFQTKCPEGRIRWARWQFTYSRLNYITGTLIWGNPNLLYQTVSLTSLCFGGCVYFLGNKNTTNCWKPQKLILLWFRRPEVWGQVIGRFGYFWRLCFTLFSQLLVAPEILGVSEALHIQLKYNSLNAISVYLWPMRLKRQVIWLHTSNIQCWDQHRKAAIDISVQKQGELGVTKEFSV